MGNIAYLCYCLIMTALFAYVLRLQGSEKTARVLLLAIIAGLVYDNGVCSIGFLIGHGDVLKAINIPRFVLHVFATPLICVVVLLLARSAGVAAASHPQANRMIGALVGLLIIVGFLQEIAPLDFVPKTQFGVLTYTHSRPAPPIAAIVVNFFCIAAAILLWRATGWPGLLITSLIMLMTGAVPPKLLGMMPSNAGEIFFVAGFVLLLKRCTVSGTTAAAARGV